MKKIFGVKLYAGSREEQLPDFSPDFPYIASHVEFNKNTGPCIPWHWHKAVELFFIESGVLEYNTPKGKTVFPAGSAGMVNSNVLHMTKLPPGTEGNTSLIHIFDAAFIAGEPGGRIERKYVTPVTDAQQLEMIPLYPDDPEQAEIIKLIRDSFRLSEQEPGYEIKLREALGEIWLRLLDASRPVLEDKKNYGKENDRIKQMMEYVHGHYGEKFGAAELAAAAFSSERECFRVFQTCLHMTPMQYIKSYRLQAACDMLAKSQEPITAVGHACGLGSSSYFGKVFREYVGCTPAEYRRKWQDINIKGQK